MKSYRYDWLKSRQYGASEDCWPPHTPSPPVLDQEEHDVGGMNKLDLNHSLLKHKQSFCQLLSKHTPPAPHLLLRYCSASYPHAKGQVWVYMVCISQSPEITFDWIHLCNCPQVQDES